MEATSVSGNKPSEAIGTTTQSVGTLLARAVKKVATALETEEV